MKIIKPDFLITGVMKGGTTILYDFITSHPEVNRSTKKEIHYFTLNYDKGDEWYSDHFSDNGKYNIEASPTYFDLATSKVIPSMIRRCNADAKIIVILRDPVERAISHFNHLVKVNGIKKLEDLGPERFFNLPYANSVKSVTEVDSILYHILNFSCYSQKLRIYMGSFGKNLLVMSNDELRAEPYKAMKRVFQFLGIDDGYSSESFEKVKYSSGTTLEQVSKETQKKLYDFFESDIASTKKMMEGMNR